MSNQANALLLKAAERGDQAGIKKALASGADPNLKIDGTPLLIGAAALGREKLVAALLDAGADANAADGSGRTAFMFVGWVGHTPAHERILDRLVQAGANIQAADDRGLTALDMAASFMNQTIVKRLHALGVSCRDEIRPLVQNVTASSSHRSQ